jgi:hypothetical protein
MTTVHLPFGHVSWPELEPLHGDRRPVRPLGARRPRPLLGPYGSVR